MSTIDQFLRDEIKDNNSPEIAASQDGTSGVPEDPCCTPPDPGPGPDQRI
jgi:hypothetical protein